MPSRISRGLSARFCLPSVWIDPSVPSFCLLLLLVSAGVRAASIRGIVTDNSGSKITGATVTLLTNGKVVGRPFPPPTAATNSHRHQRPLLHHYLRQKFSPNGNPGLLRRTPRQHRAQHGARAGVGARIDRGDCDRNSHSAGRDQCCHQRSWPARTRDSDDLVSVLRLMPGTTSVQIGQRGAQTLLFIRGGDSDDNKVLIDGVRCRRHGRPVRLRLAAYYCRRKCRSLSRARLKSVRRRCRQRRCQSQYSPRHNQFSVAFLSGDGGNFNTSHEEAELAGAITNSTISARSAGFRPPMRCPWMNIMWRPRLGISAGSPMAQPRFAARCIITSLPPACPMHGTFIM